MAQSRSSVPYLIARITQTDLANAAGTVREVSVRELRGLRAEGLIRPGREGIAILDPDALQRIAAQAGELGAEIARNLAPAGTILVYGALSSHRQMDPAKFIMPLFAPRLIYSTATVPGCWLPRWVCSQPLAEMRAATSDLLTMLSNGALTPAAIVRYSLKNFQQAVHLADGEAGQEKVLLDFSERTS